MAIGQVMNDLFVTPSTFTVTGVLMRRFQLSAKGFQYKRKFFYG